MQFSGEASKRATRVARITRHAAGLPESFATQKRLAQDDKQTAHYL